MVDFSLRPLPLRPCAVCSECPRADDPETTGVDEVQVLDCQCVTCSGTFRLSYRGQSTQTIPWDATPEFLKYRLEVRPHKYVDRHTRG